MAVRLHAVWTSALDENYSIWTAEDDYRRMTDTFTKFRVLEITCDKQVMVVDRDSSVGLATR